MHKCNSLILSSQAALDTKIRCCHGVYTHYLCSVCSADAMLWKALFGCCKVALCMCSESIAFWAVVLGLKPVKSLPKEL